MMAMKNLRDWWRSLTIPPSPLTSRQRGIVAVVTLLTAITRWMALSRTPWDWDEMLFMMAMRDYNVASHHPHPPGFPLFIAMAKAIHFTGLSDFRSLQAVSFLGAIAIVPATFFLCRELRMRFAPSVGAGAILAFFPNVWFFGGTAFSDVPSMTLVIFAAALLFRGCHDRRAYFAGAAVLGIAGGFRPQNLVIGAAPSINASVFRKWRAMLVAVLVGGAIVAVAYALAAQKTGFAIYREALSKHSVYISTVDSFRNPARPALWRLFDDFFVRPYQAPLINTIVTFLVVLSVVAAVVRTRPHVVAIVVTFGPFCLLAWLMLDHFSASRFSIGYAPMMAILAADGASILTSELLRRWTRTARLEAAFVTAVVLLMAAWTWPAIQTVRRRLSPPVASAEWIRAHVAPTEKFYVHLGMGPFAEALLPDRNTIFVEKPPTAAWSNEARTYYWREGVSNTSGAVNFMRENSRLWLIARQRYFEVSLRPLTEEVGYGEGWYDEEGGQGTVWRWMGNRSVTMLPPVRGRAHLSLSIYVPLDALPGPPPNITFSLNGAKIGQVSAMNSDIKFSADVEARTAPNELVIETDRSVRPADISRSDARFLGLRLNAIGWQPAG